MKEFASWKSYREFVKKIRFSNRYFYDGEVQNFLASVISTRNPRIKKCNIDNKFWRAQIGFKLKPVIENGKHLHDVQLPFEFDRMIPKRNNAKGGRANPPGIPHLYLATTEKTALAEVRPWLGSVISLAQFVPTKELSIIDCFTDSCFDNDFFSDEPSIESKEKRVWADINNAFSKPISNEELDTDYIPTQIISELFRNHGYDGIFYKSMLGDGLNVVLFNLDNARVVSCELFKPDKINFSFSKIEDGACSKI